MIDNIPKTDDPVLNRAFGRAVRVLRREHKLAQERLALEVAIDRSHLGALERGEHDPTLSTLWRLKLGLKVSLSRLAREIERQYANDKNKAK